MAFKFARAFSSFSFQSSSKSLISTNRVKIVEVGPRDGLQNEKMVIETEKKLKLIELLVKAGLRSIEATAFVSPKKVPQMADHTTIISTLMKDAGPQTPNFTCLIPNMKGFENAVAAGAKEVAVLNNVSETLNQKNIGLSIQQSLVQTELILNASKSQGILVRGYVSAVLGCPYEGQVDPSKVAEIAKKVYDMGCYEVSLCDTIGIGTPADTIRMLRAVKDCKVPVEILAFHAHDTYGQGLANVHAALYEGVSIIDSSIGGLGGCPFAGEGAAGNVATEDIIYMLNRYEIETGVNLEKLLEANEFVFRALQKECLNSKVAKILLSQRKKTS